MLNIQIPFLPHAPWFRRNNTWPQKQSKHPAHKINIANDLKKRLNKYSDLITSKYSSTTREQPMKHYLVNLPYAGMNFLQETIFPATLQGSGQGRLPLKLIDSVVFGRSPTFALTDSPWPWTQTQFNFSLLFVFGLRLCDVGHAAWDTPFWKLSCSDLHSIRSTKGCVASVCMCTRMHSLCHTPNTFSCASRAPSSCLCKVRRQSFVQLWMLSLTSVVRRKTVVLEMKRGSISFTLLTCRMCHVSFGLSFLYAAGRAHA